MRKTQKILDSGLHTLLWKEGKYFVAKCVEVEITSQGKTKIEALKNIEEALDLFFENEKIKVPQVSLYVSSRANEMSVAISYEIASGINPSQ